MDNLVTLLSWIGIGIGIYILMFIIAAVVIIIWKDADYMKARPKLVKAMWIISAIPVLNGIYILAAVYWILFVIGSVIYMCAKDPFDKN